MERFKAKISEILTNAWANLDAFRQALNYVVLIYYKERTYYHKFFLSWGYVATLAFMSSNWAERFWIQLTSLWKNILGQRKDPSRCLSRAKSRASPFPLQHHIKFQHTLQVSMYSTHLDLKFTSMTSIGLSQKHESLDRNRYYFYFRKSRKKLSTLLDETRLMTDLLFLLFFFSSELHCKNISMSINKKLKC